MKNKQVQAVLAVGVAATALTGCSWDGFNPAHEQETTEYGAIIMEDEFDPSTEELMEVYGPAPVENEEKTEEDFEPSIENETTKYGAVIIPNEEKDKIIEKDFNPKEDEIQMSLMYGPMPTKDDNK